MASPYKTRLRAVMQGNVAEVKVIVNHPMETGQRKDAGGKLVPAHFIQNFVATLNGRTVLNAQWSQAISANPFLGFRVEGAKSGDKVAINWVDNEGMSGSGETIVQ